MAGMSSSSSMSGMNMEASFPLCTNKKCNKAIATGTFFCPFCGTVCLVNMNIKQGTTAGYESIPAMELKPWRDPPPPRNILPKESSLPMTKKNKPKPFKEEKTQTKPPTTTMTKTSNDDWTSTTKQPQRKMKKTKSSKEPPQPPSLNAYSSNVIVIDGIPYVKMTAAGQVVNDLPPPSMSKNPQHGSYNAQLEHDDYLRPEDFPTIDNSILSMEEDTLPPSLTRHSVASVTTVVHVAPRRVWHDFVHPLAIYEATWLSDEIHDVSIHISLLERRLGICSQFWLRIGSVTTKQAVDNEEEDDSELEVLGLITNEVGKRLMPPGKDWVDLHVISPNEHYVLTYLQNILTHVADRVSSSTPRRSFIKMNRYVDQFCMIRSSKTSKSSASRFVRLEMVEEAFSLERLNNLGDVEPSSSSASVHGSTKTDRSTAVGDDDADHDQMTSSAAAPGGDGSGSESTMHFDSTIAQVTCRIPLGRHVGASRVMTSVRMSVIYHNQDPLTVLPTTPEDGIDATTTTAAHVRSLSGREEMEQIDRSIDDGLSLNGAQGQGLGTEGIGQTLHTPSVTHIKLLITPLYGLPTVQQKMMIFEVSTLPYLIGPTDVNALLTQHPKSIADFLRNLCSVFRYEFFSPSSMNHPSQQKIDTSVVKLVVVGATSLPEHMYNPCTHGISSLHPDEELDLSALGVTDVAGIDELDDVDDMGDNDNDNVSVHDDEAESNDEAVEGMVVENDEQRLLEEKEAIRASQEAAAALRVQSLARGVSSRTRVKLLRNLQQAVDIEQQLTDVEVVVEPTEMIPPAVEAPVTAPTSPPVVKAETPSPNKQFPSRRRFPPREPPKQPPAHEVELRTVKTISGTELDITGTFINDTSTSSSSQVVCQLIARDVQDNFECMSANSDSQSKQEALEAGMDYFRPKPFVYEDFEVIITTHKSSFVSHTGAIGAWGE